MKENQTNASSNKEPSDNSTTAPTLIGGALGVPASYWMQPEYVRAKMSLSDYVGALFSRPDVFTDFELWDSLIVGVVIGIIAGFVVGKLISR